MALALGGRLGDIGLQQFIVRGYHVVEPTLPQNYHAAVRTFSGGHAHYHDVLFMMTRGATIATSGLLKFPPAANSNAARSRCCSSSASAKPRGSAAKHWQTQCRCRSCGRTRLLQAHSPAFSATTGCSTITSTSISMGQVLLHRPRTRTARCGESLEGSKYLTKCSCLSAPLLQY
jgi:hypothetical protein